jgi:hypothetical protein
VYEMEVQVYNVRVICGHFDNTVVGLGPFSWNNDITSAKPEYQSRTRF